MERIAELFGRHCGRNVQTLSSREPRAQRQPFDAGRYASESFIPERRRPKCESLLDRKGENHALRMVTTKDRFRLLEELEAIKPSFEKLEWRGYNIADTPNVKREPLAYFALSVFWRASVHTWPSAEKNGKPIRIDLGKENSEALRRFLLGGSPSPSTMRLFFVVCTDRLSGGSFYLPTLSHRKDFCWTYGFAACGYFFCLNVAKRFEREQTSICFLSSPEQWIWVRDGEAKAIEGFTSLLKRQPPGKRRLIQD